MDFGEVIGFGVAPKPEFWIAPGGPVSGSVSPTSPSPGPTAAVRAFFDAAVATGADVLHEPRVWPEYHPGYYGAFVRDPDGNNIEAVCHTAE